MCKRPVRKVRDTCKRPATSSAPNHPPFLTPTKLWISTQAMALRMYEKDLDAAALRLLQLSIRTAADEFSGRKSKHRNSKVKELTEAIDAFQKTTTSTPLITGETLTLDGKTKRLLRKARNTLSHIEDPGALEELAQQIQAFKHFAEARHSEFTGAAMMWTPTELEPHRNVSTCGTSALKWNTQQGMLHRLQGNVQSSSLRF